MTGRRDGVGNWKSIIRPVVVISRRLEQVETKITETKEIAVIEFHERNGG